MNTENKQITFITAPACCTSQPDGLGKLHNRVGTTPGNWELISYGWRSIKRDRRAERTRPAERRRREKLCGKGERKLYHDRAVVITTAIKVTNKNERLLKENRKHSPKEGNKYGCRAEKQAASEARYWCASNQLASW